MLASIFHLRAPRVEIAWPRRRRPQFFPLVFTLAIHFDAFFYVLCSVFCSRGGFTEFSLDTVFRIFVDFWLAGKEFI